MREPVAVGDVIADKYRIDRILGRGGMGMVVAATHLELRKARAIKLMLPEANAVPRAIERFFREARAASALTSEHVAHVFDVGRLENGVPFIVMEHLKGRDLADELARRITLPVEEAALYIIQVCEALAEAHGHGIVHRDIKPGNLFLTSANDGSPSVKVLDFGISKLLDPEKAAIDGHRTTSGTILGSPLYMSPEQIRADRDLDERCDIWGLGVILYQLITGRLPFDCGSVVQSLAMILERSPPPPSEQTPGLPPTLDAVILRCLEKRSADRYPSVAALARDLLPFAPPDAAPLVERVGRVAASGAQVGAASTRRAIAPSPAAFTMVTQVALPSPSPAPSAPAPGVATASGMVAERPLQTPLPEPVQRRFSSSMIAGAIGLMALMSGTLALSLTLRGLPRVAALPASSADLSSALAPPSIMTASSVSLVTSVAPPASATGAPVSSSKSLRSPVKRWSSAPPRY